ncbi:uncharacterized protein N7473_001840 [Penicillium subrubescens]|uniref:uncharacterized protein n=1 Tax=Penicillium subrubescens TaxID=1316194 RepID=UPI002544DECB|nr:uncharacterized protein N7473_001840 [Penicillium subrubescens]KAJ5904924.1 hypothetical protein N7473_001840 [Penicillium subrubescens]
MLLKFSPYNSYYGLIDFTAIMAACVSMSSGCQLKGDVLGSSEDSLSPHRQERHSEFAVLSALKDMPRARCRRKGRRQRHINSRAARALTQTRTPPPPSLQEPAMPSKSFLRELLIHIEGRSIPAALRELYMLSGMPEGFVPYQAQHFILQTMQRCLEQNAFQFAQKWLVSESQALGWTCPEALELHIFFRVLAKQQRKVRSDTFQEICRTVKDWQDSISNIRHAAVHRLAQDRSLLIEMSHAAVGFSRDLGASSSAAKFHRLSSFLKKVLPKSEPRGFQPTHDVVSQASSQKARLVHLIDRLRLLPRPIKKVLLLVEEEFTLGVQHFLQDEFPMRLNAKEES